MQNEETSSLQSGLRSYVPPAEEMHIPLSQQAQSQMWSFFLGPLSHSDESSLRCDVAGKECTVHVLGPQGEWSVALAANTVPEKNLLQNLPCFNLSMW